MWTRSWAAFLTCVVCAASAGIYCIIPLVNGAAAGNVTHPAIAGGMQWYVDQAPGNNTGFGSGGFYNLFYTDARVKQVGFGCQLLSVKR